MVQTTTAIYENGLLRPTVTLDLPEHSEVEITIHTSEDSLRTRVRKAFGSDEPLIKTENPISDERRAELARIFSAERPISDYIDEDRDARWIKFIYADSSVLVKRHILETGSAWFRNLVLSDSNDLIISAKLSTVEVFSSFNRRKREASISQNDYNDFAKDFLAISKNEYELLNLSDMIIIEAQKLLETYPLRTGDAIQLATAIYARDMLQDSQLSALIFLASDKRLLNAAQVEQFAVDNPLLYP